MARPPSAPVNRGVTTSALPPLGSSPPTSPPTSTRPTPPDWRPPATRLNIHNLPPLPAIPCPELARQARTHYSAIPTSINGEPVTQYEREAASFEPLEMIGDRRLGWAVAKEMRRRFHSASSAVLAHLTSLIVRNVTISHFAHAYGLHLGVIGSAAPNGAVCGQGMAADLFEAHIGALAEYEELHPGEPPRLDRWLAQLASDATLPDLADEARERIAQLMTPRITKKAPATERLHWSCARCSTGVSAVVTAPIVTFDHFDQEAGWHAHVWHDGQHMGCASGKSKKEAEMKALYGVVAIRSAGQRCLEEGE